MQRKDLTPEVIQAAIKSYYETTSAHVAWLMKTVGNGTGSVPKTPRKLGSYQFDYFFAADIDQLARFALGGLPASRRYILDLCETAEATLFATPAGVRAPIPAEFGETPLGFIVALARARAALRTDSGPPLDAAAVRILAGESDAYLKKSGLLAPGGDSPEVVRAFLENNGHPA